jgi:hypothetical protein
MLVLPESSVVARLPPVSKLMTPRVYWQIVKHLDFGVISTVGKVNGVQVEAITMPLQRNGNVMHGVHGTFPSRKATEIGDVRSRKLRQLQYLLDRST